MSILVEIQAAYTAHGLRPVREVFFVHGQADAACPLAALAIHRGEVNRADPALTWDNAANPAFDWACDEFGMGWTFGFMDAFDGRPMALEDAAYLEGYSMGALAGERLLPAGH